MQLKTLTEDVNHSLWYHCLCRRRFHLRPQRQISHRRDATTCRWGKSQRLWRWLSKILFLISDYTTRAERWWMVNWNHLLLLPQRLLRGYGRSTTQPSSRWSRPTSTTSWGNMRSQVSWRPQLGVHFVLKRGFVCLGRFELFVYTQHPHISVCLNVQCYMKVWCVKKKKKRNNNNKKICHFGETMFSLSHQLKNFFPFSSVFHQWFSNNPFCIVHSKRDTELKKKKPSFVPQWNGLIVLSPGLHASLYYASKFPPFCFWSWNAHQAFINSRVWHIWSNMG